MSTQRTRLLLLVAAVLAAVVPVACSSTGGGSTSGGARPVASVPATVPSPTAACVALRADLDQWTVSYNLNKAGRSLEAPHPGIEDRVWLAVTASAYTPAHLAEKQEAYHRACE